jgi:glutaredoxin
MKLIKIEKDFCPACNIVGAFLADTGVEYTTLNIMASGTPEKEKEAEEARELLGKLQLFTVPVTVVLDGQGEIVDHAKGNDQGKLTELVELVK